MPNHVSNAITLKGHKDDIIKCLSTIMRDNDPSENENKYEGIGTIDFEKIIPMPKEIYNGSNNWYDWSIRNWGTKWNAYNIYSHEIMSVDDINEGEDYTMEFDTAWNPPYPVIKTLSEMYPEIEIKHLYFDEFLNFAGIVMYKDGLPKKVNQPTNPKEVFELVCSEYWHCTPEEDGAVLNILNNDYVYLGNEYLRCTIEFEDKHIVGLTNHDWSIDKKDVPNMMRYYTVRMRNNTLKGIDSFNFNAGRNNDDVMSFMVMADTLDASTIDRMNKHPEKIYLTISDTDNDVSLEEFINENTKA